MTWTLQRFAAFLNVCFLAVVFARFLPDHGTLLNELVWFGLVAMQFTVPVISILALLSKPRA
jgi:hypothetical protein